MAKKDSDTAVLDPQIDEDQAVDQDDDQVVSEDVAQFADAEKIMDAFFERLQNKSQSRQTTVCPTCESRLNLSYITFTRPEQWFPDGCIANADQIENYVDHELKNRDDENDNGILCPVCGYSLLTPTVRAKLIKAIQKAL